jgi:hypothetical protein
MRRIQLLAIGLSLLISTTAWPELRTYEVDFEYRQEVWDLARLWRTYATCCSPRPSHSVNMLPNGLTVAGLGSRLPRCVGWIVMTRFYATAWMLLCAIHCALCV